VFENIIEQGAVLQLRDDILSSRLAPSMLFYGPSASGKGSAALELARVLSCEADGAWKCSCPSCENSRYLQHNDHLMLGYRSFAGEINACAAAFLKNTSAAGAKLLFIRSVRRLQMRFSPVLMEDDKKLKELSSVLQALEEGLDEFRAAGVGAASCENLVKTAHTLIEDGIPGAIPVGHIRAASRWCNLTPAGKRKTLIIENAQDMSEESRNSLLKLLEEPPSTVTIVLTSHRREAIMPTILSRLRPYRFLKRSAQGEKEILRRVFQVTQDDASLSDISLSAYLESFLPSNNEKLYPLAAWFIVSLARITAASMKKSGGDIPQIINALGERYANVANNAGFERSLKPDFIVSTLVAKSENFESDSFTRFLKICLDMVSDVIKNAQSPQYAAYSDVFGKCIAEAYTAVNALNVKNKTLVLETLLFKLKKGLAGGVYV
jgi:DNA polymerase-3 subunit gamma/tau